MFLIRAGAIENIDGLIRQKGHNPNELLAEVGWTSHILRQPEALVSYNKMADLLDYCALVCDAPLFGFNLAQIQSPLVLGEWISLLAQQASVQDGVEFAKQYHHLHARGYEFIEKDNGERRELQYEFQFTNRTDLTHLMQLSVGQMAEYARIFIPGQYDQIRIHTTQSIPKEWHSALGWYKTILVSGSDYNGISFPTKWLNRSLARNQQISDMLYQKQISSLNALYPNDLSSQVRHLCNSMLATGECTIENVASSLDLKARTLQSRLEREGLTFRALLQQVRQQKAEQYLRDSQLSVTDIALNLGYAESSVFVRSFKDWTGLTPLKWRKESREQL